MMPYRKKAEVIARMAEVRAVYAAADALPVVRQCVRRTDCCYFRRTGLTPQLTAGEALVAAKAWRATGRRELKSREDEGCPLLVGPTGQAKCAIYAERPFGCRTHFCEEAGGPYSRRDVLEHIRSLEIIDDALGGNGPKALRPAIEEALGFV